MASGDAPAWECADCRTLSLDESAANSDEERKSVRVAKAARASTTSRPPPPSALRPPATPDLRTMYRTPRNLGISLIEGEGNGAGERESDDPSDASE